MIRVAGIPVLGIVQILMRPWHQQEQRITAVTLVFPSSLGICEELERDWSTNMQFAEVCSRKGSSLFHSI